MSEIDYPTHRLPRQPTTSTSEQIHQQYCTLSVREQKLVVTLTISLKYQGSLCIRSFLFSEHLHVVCSMPNAAASERGVISPVSRQLKYRTSVPELLSQSPQGHPGC